MGSVASDKADAMKKASMLLHNDEFLDSGLDVIEEDRRRGPFGARCDFVGWILRELKMSTEVRLMERATSSPLNPPPFFS
ncbi:pyrophosphate--fructose 6-phosphate 1-phosphotransferase subunit alpha isoform X2 [Iris pallida]|uniref:Pyrophosphate--fructose 6-phosphate 1-phosphotransferase subunit alpha isoform X2 n=1 Tax=Iris pallida TaxID=29817 RepID=A0AAX6GXK2_IRIPA|nr:pyrophosphate--fructose 6-phosphate 1-phosphotransferase subunit alpha isoform X2 [Iris pallida]KAJ6833233.1 pyrophosphate--fructose 6-phosphate 1-phosphotransferase subunit alpha isoform X2 [Iris pallida]